MGHHGTSPWDSSFKHQEHGKEKQQNTLKYYYGQAPCVARKFTGTFPANFMMMMMMMIEDLQ